MVMRSSSNLGEGSFAEVRKQRLNNGEEVAVKRILDTFKHNENYTKRFIKEVEMLKKLNNHPNIVPLLEVRINEDEHEYAYVMPKAKSNLAEFMKINHEKLDDIDRIQLFDQIVEALTTAHSKNILHRDLSPNNILITDNDTVWVADFGLGKDYDKRTIGGNSSLQGHGTYSYVAPEQLDKLSNATKRSDVYSLGKILHFILTGKEPPIVISSSPQYLVLIQKATADNPENRMEDAIEFQLEYERAKQIQQILGQDDKDKQTLNEFMHSNPQASWDEFHEIAMKCNIVDHDWYDFITPAMEKLKDINEIYDYVDHLGDSSVIFMKLFRERLDKMPGVGWPYHQAKKIDAFAERYFKGSIDCTNGQKEALELLWDWAAKEDRWDAQDTIISIITGNKIKKEDLENHLAYYMLTVNKSFQKLNSVNTKVIKSPAIKRAIITLKSYK